MLNELNIVCPEDKELVRHRIELIEKETGTVLDEMQKKAITEAADHGLFILTGGPGTGKTTTINAIIRFLRRRCRDSAGCTYRTCCKENDRDYRI